MHGIIQRLVQKEKAAVKLQAEVDKLRLENEKLVEASVSAYKHLHTFTNVFRQEEQERIKRERDRAKWNAMTEEMANSKAKVRLNAHILDSMAYYFLDC